MTHSEERGSWKKEALIGWFAGVLYGATNVIVGHPFDTVKTKMQAQTQHMNYKVRYRTTLLNIIRQEGFLGLYKGGGINAAGVITQRSFVQGSFELFYTKWENDPVMNKAIPYSNGLQYRTVIAALIAGSVRSMLECPFEYTKVRLQTG